MTWRGGKTWLAGLLIAVAALGAALGYFVHVKRLEAELFTHDPDLISTDSRLEAFAVRLARSAFARHCAGCHGDDREGRGTAPNLVDRKWLFGTGRVLEIEQTILFGIRSGHGKARNPTDMPAFGRDQKLSPADIRDVVAYVRALRGNGADGAPAANGEVLFSDKGLCYDCHGPDGKGNEDYGAPDLTEGILRHGDTSDALYHSINDGVHDSCPAWIDVLKPVEIRALAVLLQTNSAPASPSGGSNAAPD